MADCGLRIADCPVQAAPLRHPSSAIRQPQSEVLWLPLSLDYDPAADPLAPQGRRETPWTAADCLIDVGYALGNRDNLERLVLPLEERLRRLGVRRVALGGTRKVTEE